MEIYYYCSYKGSPTGFRVGKINTDTVPKTGNIALSPEGIDPFIRRVFESGLMIGAFGKIPSKTDTRYFLLKKKLEMKVDDRNYYLNIALVDNDPDKVFTLLHLSTDKDKLAAVITNTMELSKENKFGYTIKAEKLQELLKCGYGSVCNYKSTLAKPHDFFYATLITETPDVDRLNKDLGVAKDSDTRFDVSHTGDKLFSVKKKQGKTTTILKIAIAAAIPLIVFAALLTVISLSCKAAILKASASEFSGASPKKISSHLSADIPTEHSPADPKKIGGSF